MSTLESTKGPRIPTKTRSQLEARFKDLDSRERVLRPYYSGKRTARGTHRFAPILSTAAESSWWQVDDDAAEHVLAQQSQSYEEFKSRRYRQMFVSGSATLVAAGMKTDPELSEAHADNSPEAHTTGDGHDLSPSALLVPLESNRSAPSKTLSTHPSIASARSLRNPGDASDLISEKKPSSRPQSSSSIRSTTFSTAAPQTIDSTGHASAKQPTPGSGTAPVLQGILRRGTSIQLPTRPIAHGGPSVPAIYIGAGGAVQAQALSELPARPPTVTVVRARCTSPSRKLDLCSVRLEKQSWEAMEEQVRARTARMASSTVWNPNRPSGGLDGRVAGAGNSGASSSSTTSSMDASRSGSYSARLQGARGSPQSPTGNPLPLGPATGGWTSENLSDPISSDGFAALFEVKTSKVMLKNFLQERSNSRRILSSVSVSGDASNIGTLSSLTGSISNSSTSSLNLSTDSSSSLSAMSGDRNRTQPTFSGPRRLGSSSLLSPSGHHDPLGSLDASSGSVPSSTSIMFPNRKPSLVVATSMQDELDALLLRRRSTRHSFRPTSHLSSDVDTLGSSSDTPLEDTVLPVPVDLHHPPSSSKAVAEGDASASGSISDRSGASNLSARHQSSSSSRSSSRPSSRPPSSGRRSTSGGKVKAVGDVASHNVVLATESSVFSAGDQNHSVDPDHPYSSPHRGQPISHSQNLTASVNDFDGDGLVDPAFPSNEQRRHRYEDLGGPGGELSDDSPSHRAELDDSSDSVDGDVSPGSSAHQFRHLTEPWHGEVDTGRSESSRDQRAPSHSIRFHGHHEKPPSSSVVTDPSSILADVDRRTWSGETSSATTLKKTTEWLRSSKKGHRSHPRSFADDARRESTDADASVDGHHRVSFKSRQVLEHPEQHRAQYRREHGHLTSEQQQTRGSSDKDWYSAGDSLSALHAVDENGNLVADSDDYGAESDIGSDASVSSSFLSEDDGNFRGENVDALVEASKRSTVFSGDDGTEDPDDPAFDNPDDLDDAVEDGDPSLLDNENHPLLLSDQDRLQRSLRRSGRRFGHRSSKKKSYVQRLPAPMVSSLSTLAHQGHPGSNPAERVDGSILESPRAIGVLRSGRQTYSESGLQGSLDNLRSSKLSDQHSTRDGSNTGLSEQAASGVVGGQRDANQVSHIPFAGRGVMALESDDSQINNTVPIKITPRTVARRLRNDLKSSLDEQANEIAEGINRLRMEASQRAPMPLPRAPRRKDVKIRSSIEKSFSMEPSPAFVRVRKEFTVRQINS